MYTIIQILYKNITSQWTSNIYELNTSYGPMKIKTHSIEQSATVQLKINM